MEYWYAVQIFPLLVWNHLSLVLPPHTLLKSLSPSFLQPPFKHWEAALAILSFILSYLIKFLTGPLAWVPLTISLLFKELLGLGLLVFPQCSGWYPPLQTLMKPCEVRKKWMLGRAQHLTPSFFFAAVQPQPAPQTLSILSLLQSIISVLTDIKHLFGFVFFFDTKAMSEGWTAWFFPYFPKCLCCSPVWRGNFPLQSSIPHCNKL